MKKSLQLILVLFICFSLGCDQDISVDRSTDITNLLNDINIRVDDIKSKKSSTLNSKTTLNPSNLSNPYNHYGEAFTALVNSLETETKINQNEISDEEFVSYLQERQNLLPDNINLSSASIHSIIAYDDQYSAYSDEEMIIDLYAKGEITNNVKLLLLDYVQNVSEVDQNTFIEISEIYENSISSGGYLTSVEETQTLATITLTKHNNVLIPESLISRRCAKKGIGGAILGTVICGGGCGIIGGIVGYFGCLIGRQRIY
ncbi:MAG: hypothetical protein AAGF85_19190 [Bacteroidota bacterium]